MQNTWILCIQNSIHDFGVKPLLGEFVISMPKQIPLEIIVIICTIKKIVQLCSGDWNIEHKGKNFGGINNSCGAHGCNWKSCLLARVKWSLPTLPKDFRGSCSSSFGFWPSKGSTSWLVKISISRHRAPDYGAQWDDGAEIGGMEWHTGRKTLSTSWRVKQHMQSFYDYRYNLMPWSRLTVLALHSAQTRSRQGLYKRYSRDTLRFFHQYFLLSFPALASNWDAPACNASIMTDCQREIN